MKICNVCTRVGHPVEERQVPSLIISSPVRPIRKSAIGRHLPILDSLSERLLSRHWCSEAAIQLSARAGHTTNIRFLVSPSQSGLSQIHPLRPRLSFDGRSGLKKPRDRC
jgi:hypothetical protein